MKNNIILGTAIAIVILTLALILIIHADDLRYDQCIVQGHSKTVCLQLEE